MISRPTRRALLAGVATLALSHRVHAVPTDGDPLATLIALMCERLELITEVAKSKWNTGTAVEDLAREKQLLDAVTAAAPAHGLDPELATTFFRAQIEAAKLLESAVINGWMLAHAPAFADAPDQRTFIRPKIDRLTGALLAALAAARPNLQRSEAERIAGATHLQDASMAFAMTRAVQPLLELCGVRAGAG
jgi:chorismate mutase-like protein